MSSINMKGNRKSWLRLSNCCSYLSVNTESKPLARSCQFLLFFKVLDQMICLVMPLIFELPKRASIFNLFDMSGTPCVLWINLSYICSKDDVTEEMETFLNLDDNS